MLRARTITGTLLAIPENTTNGPRCWANAVMLSPHRRRRSRSATGGCGGVQLARMNEAAWRRIRGLAKEAGSTMGRIVFWMTDDRRTNESQDDGATDERTTDKRTTGRQAMAGPSSTRGAAAATAAELEISASGRRAKNDCRERSEGRVMTGADDVMMMMMWLLQ